MSSAWRKTNAATGRSSYEPVYNAKKQREASNVDSAEGIMGERMGDRH